MATITTYYGRPIMTPQERHNLELVRNALVKLFAAPPDSPMPQRLQRQVSDAIQIANGMLAKPGECPRHIRAMAKAVQRQLTEAHPREELDLDAVRALATFVVGPVTQINITEGKPDPVV